MEKKRLIQKYHLVFVVPALGQLDSYQTFTTKKDEKSEEVKSFEENQWRLEYILDLPNTELSNQTSHK